MAKELKVDGFDEPLPILDLNEVPLAAVAEVVTEKPERTVEFHDEIFAAPVIADPVPAIDEGPTADDAVKLTPARLQGWNAAVAAIVAEFEHRVARGPANDHEGHRRAREVAASFHRE